MAEYARNSVTGQAINTGSTGRKLDETLLNTEKDTTTAGKDLGAKGSAGKKPMPKQSDFGGDATAWGDAMRKWRDGMKRHAVMMGGK